MPDRLDPLAGLAEQGHAVLRRARSAAQVTGRPGSDPTGSVNVTLDTDGRVVGVTVTAGWQQKIDAEKLAEAVIDAVRDAAGKRLHAWGEAYSDNSLSQPSSSAVESDADRGAADRDELQRRLQEMATAPLSGEDRQAALSELLALAEAIERGIDEVSSNLQATLNLSLTGHSPDRHVTVTITGGGEVTAVRFDRVWLRQAHEINIGRQITAAFRAAYEQVAAHGVDRLIAGSALGEVQRVVQDPFGLARRLRLTE